MGLDLFDFLFHHPAPIRPGADGRRLVPLFLCLERLLWSFDLPGGKPREIPDHGWPDSLQQPVFAIHQPDSGGFVALSDHPDHCLLPGSAGLYARCRDHRRRKIIRFDETLHAQLLQITCFGVGSLFSWHLIDQFMKNKLFLSLLVMILLLPACQPASTEVAVPP
jgi:hypothetical protein